jgi:hypothetical protein
VGDELKIRRSIIPLIPIDVIDRIVLTEWSMKLAINHSVNAQVLTLVFYRKVTRFRHNKGQLPPFTSYALLSCAADGGQHRAIGPDLVPGIVNQSLNINIIDRMPEVQLDSTVAAQQFTSPA